MNWFLRFFAVCCIILICRSQERNPGTTRHPWSYDFSAKFGPDNWHNLNPTCRGFQQSPIDINIRDVVVSDDLPAFDFSGYNRTITGATLHNNGYTARVKMNGRSGIILRGGGLQTWYELVSFHFHWGPSSIDATEHRFGSDLNFALEMHMLHTRNGISTKEALASDDFDSFAVVSLMFELTLDRTAVSEGLQSVIESLQYVPFKDENYPLPQLNMTDLLPSDTSNFFRYNGSLTTPPCSESVVWSIVVQPMKIHPDQLRYFSRLLQMSRAEVSRYEPTKLSIESNFRPTQLLRNRQVLVRKPIVSSAAGHLYTSISVCSVIISFIRTFG